MILYIIEELSIPKSFAWDSIKATPCQQGAAVPQPRNIFPWIGGGSRNKTGPYKWLLSPAAEGISAREPSITPRNEAGMVNASHKPVLYF